MIVIGIMVLKNKLIDTVERRNGKMIRKEEIEAALRQIDGTIRMILLKV